jgi:hypothetical protein
VGIDVLDNYDIDNIERILDNGCCADIHDKELVPGVLVVLRTSVAQEESRRNGSAANPCWLQAPAQARAPGLARA